MDKFLMILSLWETVTKVIQTVHDKGFQSVVRNTLKAIEQSVLNGYLPSEMGTVSEEQVKAIVTAHPAVQNFSPVPAPVSILDMDSLTNADLDRIAGLLAKRQAPVGAGVAFLDPALTKGEITQ